MCVLHTPGSEGTGRGSIRQGLGRKSPRAGVFYLESHHSHGRRITGTCRTPHGQHDDSQFGAALPRHPGGGFGGLTHACHRG